MAKPTKKDLDKRRKERDRKRQAVSELARAAGIAPWVEPVRPVPGPHAEFPTWTGPLSAVDSPMERASSADRVKEAIVALNTPPPPPREETEERKQIRGWWREYKDADGETRQQMAREKLAVLNPEDEQFEAFFPDAISEVEPKLGRERYVAFLEEIRDRWPRMYHFYDFLAETQLVDEAIRQPSQLVCRDLWKDVKNLFQKKPCEWRLYEFLEPYATWKDR